MPTLDPERVREVTESVLARRELAPARPGPVDRVLGWVVEQIFRVLYRLFGDGGQGISTVRVVVFALLLALVGYLLWRFLRGVGREASTADELARDVGRAPTDWAAEAEGHERAARHREAVRCRYRLLLARLAERGVIEEIPGRTSGEYLREASAALPAAGEDLRGATEAFERAWYADEPVTARDVDTVREAGERAAAAPLAGPQRTAVDGADGADGADGVDVRVEAPA